MSTQQNKRPRLADVIGDDVRESLARAWDETQAAASFDVIPKGHHLLEAVAGNVDKSSQGTPSYCVRFRVVTPGSPQCGRLIFHRFYLTKAALPMSKRDLATLGITTLAQLDQTLPQGLRVEADVIVRTLDDGRQTNELRHFKTAPPAGPDPFAPTQDEEPETSEQSVETEPSEQLASEETEATLTTRTRRPRRTPATAPSLNGAGDGPSPGDHL
jgi:hypothetical protein